jgi:outer membrane protein OmpA-like peptidoglycan-associated protein
LNIESEEVMRKLMIAGAVASAFLGGCASMPSAELSECLQPNRRVVVEVGGTVLKPKPKPKPAAEGEKPAAKPAADKPAAKPAKPQYAPIQLNALAQGNNAFDIGSAVLKDEGKAELDELVATLAKRKVNVGSVIIGGHTDRFEAESANANLSEERAKAAVAYLASKGVDQKLMFWEGKGAKEPVPVTKFCE